MSKRWCLGIALCCACAAHICADPPDGTLDPHVHGWRPWARICPSVGCCPDDYVHKPLPPNLGIPRCGTADDYHRKPLPPAPPVPRCDGPNDYCRKLLPYLLCPPVSPYLQCGPSNGKCDSYAR